MKFSLCLVHFVKQTIASVYSRFTCWLRNSTCCVLVFFMLVEVTCSGSGLVHTLVARKAFQGFDMTGPLLSQVSFVPVICWLQSNSSWCTLTRWSMCVCSKKEPVQCLELISFLGTMNGVAMPPIYQQVAEFHKVWYMRPSEKWASLDFHLLAWRGEIPWLQSQNAAEMTCVEQLSKISSNEWNAYAS